MPALPALAVAAVLVVGAPTTTAVSCTAPADGGTARTSSPGARSDHDPQVSFSADCDVDNHAVNVKPNTAEARRAAEQTCQATGTAIDAAPWPDGWHPVPLDDVTGNR